LKLCSFGHPDYNITGVDKFKIQRWVYGHVLRPYLFTIDSEVVHDKMSKQGESMENIDWLLETLYSYKNKKLRKSILGIDFENPVGLAAGFDYNGHLAKAMKHIGFGFNTVGTVTAKPYEGNKPPRLGRLVKSQSILVNKGFKSEGAVKVVKRLDAKNLNGHIIGISVGSSNIPSVNTIEKAIKDYLFTFNVFKTKPYVKYFELNISCPNTAIKEPFSDTQNFEKLVNAITKLNLKQPIFVKMPSEITLQDAEKLVAVGLKYSIRGYIFSNLVKDRSNKFLVKSEIEEVANLKGNFSGKPCFENSNKLLKHIRSKFGNKVVLVGLGGIFTPQDAIEKFKCGADLVQLITGMIFEGPQIAGHINSILAKLPY